MSVVVARPAIAALEARGIDVDGVLRVAGVSHAALDDIERRLPTDNLRAIWEAAAIATGDPSFGVHVAESVPLGSLDVIEYIVATSRNLGDSLQRLIKYSRLIQDPGEMHIEVEPLAARIVRRRPHATPQFDEFGMAILVVRTREATGVHFRPERMVFQHEHPGRDGELERVFGCPISFGADHVELVLASSLLELPFQRSDSRLLAILERYAGSLVDALPHHVTMVTRVLQTITREMAERLPTIASTARALRLPPRTLQRRLAEEGGTHSSLVDDVRRELALQHIGDAHVSISEIGYMLHFSDETAFYRAFKRWTGESPRSYRARVWMGKAS